MLARAYEELKIKLLEKQIEKMKADIEDLKRRSWALLVIIALFFVLYLVEIYLR